MVEPSLRVGYFFNRYMPLVKLNMPFFVNNTLPANNLQYRAAIMTPQAVIRPCINQQLADHCPTGLTSNDKSVV